MSSINSAQAKNNHYTTDNSRTKARSEGGVDTGTNNSGWKVASCRRIQNPATQSETQRRAAPTASSFYESSSARTSKVRSPNLCISTTAMLSKTKNLLQLNQPSQCFQVFLWSPDLSLEVTGVVWRLMFGEETITPELYLLSGVSLLELFPCLSTSKKKKKVKESWKPEGLHFP